MSIASRSGARIQTVRCSCLALWCALALSACEGVVGDADAGTAARDAGAFDAGPAADTGPPVDAGPPRDSGATPDASAPADAGPPRVLRIFAGLSSGDVVTYALEADRLRETSRTRTGADPSFLAASADGRFLFAVHGGAREVASIAITPMSGALRVLSRRGSGGDGPTHVTASPDGRSVFVANYGGGSVAMYSVGADGMLSDSVDVEMPGVRAHQVVVDAESAHLYVPCLGSDRVAQFDIGASGLTAMTPASVSVMAGAGPRHMALSPSQSHAYVIHELDSTVTVHARAASGTLGPSLQRISTLPAGFSGSNTTAEIVVHPSGQYVYGSNRGHDSVAIFRVLAGGMLELVAHERTRGEIPRSMTLTPDGSALLVANQRSGDVQVFDVAAATGLLTHRFGHDTGVGTPFVGAFDILAE